MIAPVPVSAADNIPASGTASAYVWMVAGAGALGGLLFGYDWVVIGGAKPFYEIYFRLASPGSWAGR